MLTNEIKVELVRDDKGRLLGIKEIDVIHYYIRLYINEPDNDIIKVVYELDPTYFNSKIEIKADIKNFLTEITSYGDYDIKVNIYYKDSIDIVSINLYKALEKTYQNDNSPEIKQALEQIKRL